MCQLFTSISLLVLSLCIVVYPVYNLIYINPKSLSNLENCTICFGTNMCGCLEKNLFSVNWNYFWTNVVALSFGKKRIIFGNCCNESVVIKKSESKNINERYDCLNYFYRHNYMSPVEIAKYFITRPLQKSKTLLQKFMLCPTIEKFESLLPPIMNQTNFDRLSEFYCSINSMMKENMEPIVQQVAKEWAVAEYLGGCGDLTFSKYCGEILTTISPKLTWALRSSIARQLLLFAHNATFQHPAFAFYFTDMTPDNFAVSPEGTVKLVDLDNVIVVDKNPTDPPKDWDDQHQSCHEEDLKGFAYSPGDICSHKTSDHNIYSICQGILSNKSDLISGGLLHSPPEHKQRITGLLARCVNPEEGESRIDLAKMIIDELEE